MSDATPPAGVVSATSGADGIEIVRVFDAARELVFKAWTESERFAAWFGEDGSEVPLETMKMDARPGGEWSLIMLYGPARTELPFGGVFREVVAPERVVMTVTDQSGGENADVFIVDLKDLGDGRTEMTFAQRGGNLPSDEYSRAMRGELIFFERMARQFADSLKARHDSD